MFYTIDDILNNSASEQTPSFKMNCEYFKDQTIPLRQFDGFQNNL